MRGIEKLHPELRPIAEEFRHRCLGAGLNVLITETLRTQAEQTALYEQGRTKPGSIVTRAKYPNSPHCWGVAFDFCRNKKGQEYVNTDGFFEKCGAIGKGLGLTWGGDWKSFPDRPHLELKRYMPSASCKWLIATYGSPETFFKTWKQTAGEPVEQPEEKEEKKMVYETYADLPDWAKGAVKKLMDKGAMRGDEKGNLNLSEDMARMCVLLDRLELCE